MYILVCTCMNVYVYLGFMNFIIYMCVWMRYPGLSFWDVDLIFLCDVDGIDMDT